MTNPTNGIFVVIEEDEPPHEHAVQSARFNTYSEGSFFWLILFVRAAPIPTNEIAQLPNIEIDIPLSRHPWSVLRPKQSLVISSYHELYSNLTDLYYYSHHAFDGRCTVTATDESTLSLAITGETDFGSVEIHATFRRDPTLKRGLS